jgi:hypothetical protein
MAIQVSQPAASLRATIARLAGIKPAPRALTATFEGDGVTASFEVPEGFKPTGVYVDGLRKSKGPLDDYTVDYDGFATAVVFAVAPGAVKILVDCVEVRP